MESPDGASAACSESSPESELSAADSKPSAPLRGIHSITLKSLSQKNILKSLIVPYSSIIIKKTSKGVGAEHQVLRLSACHL